MAREPASEETQGQVDRLVSLLFEGVGPPNETIADVARNAGLGHETVRRLNRNPGGGSRSGPGFLVVAAIAKARNLSLDHLARRTFGDDPMSGAK